MPTDSPGQGNTALSLKKQSLYFCAAYTVLAAASMVLPSPIPPISPLWLPGGVVLIALLVGGLKLLPVVLLVTILTGFSWLLLLGLLSFNGALISVIVGLGVMLEALLARRLILRLEPSNNGPPELVERSSMYGFVLSIAVASTVSATVGIATLTTLGNLPTQDAAYAWLLWWASDAVGMLLVTTVLLPWVVPITHGSSIWKSRRGSLDVSMLLLTAALLTAFAYSWQSQKSAMQSRIAERGATVEQGLRQAFDAYLETLFSIESYFQSSNFVDRDEFSRFTKNYIQRYEALRGIAWAPRTDAAEIEPLKQSARQDGFSNFSLRSYSPQSGIGSANDEHYPIFYAVPPASGQRVMGYDLLTHPDRSAALRQSLKTGLPASTVPITLVEDSTEKPAILVVNAFYPAEPGSENKPLGASVLAMQLGDVVEASLGKIDLYNLELQLVDTAAGRTLVMYDDRRTAIYDASEFTPHSINTLSWSRDFPLAGQSWELRLYSKPGFAASIRGRDSYLLLIISFALSALVAILQLVSSGYTARVERLVAARTAELSNSNEQLQDAAVRQKQISETLQQQTSELKRSNQELQQFAYIASHDLQEPLRSITGFSNLLKKRYAGQLDDAGNEYVDFIANGTERMRQIIVDLLTYSRAGSRQLVPESIDMQHVFETAKTNLAASIAESDATITACALPTLTADAQQMTLLLQNFIGNAIKYRAKERPVNIKLTAEQKSRGWQFAIQDNGIGIRSEHYSQIFEIFKRLHSTVYYKGTGIGLAVCKRIVQRHGGELWVESVEGEGSTFYFLLPHTLPEHQGPEQ